MKQYKKLCVLLLTALIVAGSLGAFSLCIHYRTKNEEQLIHELQNRLVSAAACYQNRSVTLTIDGHKHSYTMKQLGEHIYYEYRNGATYELGKEEALARTIFKANGASAGNELIQLIRCKCQEEAVTKIIKNLADTYNTPARNARINSKGKIIASEAGHCLDTTKIYKELTNYLNKKTLEDYSATYQTSTISPTWTAKQLKRVNTIISSYSTSFGSTTPRGTNIRIAASRLNNHFLLPGKSISFLDVLYDESDGKTYKKSGSYFKGKVVQATGGGICQVSTTAYGTFLFAGIIPTKRYPHSIPVSYSPLGLDAALSVGGKDLQIRNTLDVPILILARTKGNRLTVQIKSYKNALKGYRYQPKAVKLSSLKAKAYLDVYKNGKKKKTILLSKDSYKKIS